MLKRLIDRVGRAEESPRRFPALFEDAPGGDLVALDIETTSLDPRRAEILAIGAVKIRGNRILTSQRFSVIVKPEQHIDPASVRIHTLRPADVAGGLDIGTALERLVAFMGTRPLVGYYLEFDLAVINRALLEVAGVRLPNDAIEVSALYYDIVARRGHRLRLYGELDLRAETLLRELGMPKIARHDAVGDAIAAALMYLKLQQLSRR